MLIREVILENFMSYEYARVPLKKGVNVVAGPNGSGKSSFLLGICVALGETYTERSKRLSDLIRWGQDQARISLLLDNSIREDGLRPIPQVNRDVIRLTRNLRKDGKYWFELGQKNAQKYEVMEILRGLGFDPNNMLIVMHQGMPEQFAHVSSQEKLRTLETAVGYESFRSDVVEAKKKLGGILSEEESLIRLLDRARETLAHWREQNERLQEKKRLRTRSQFLQREMAWSQVGELEKLMAGLEREIDLADADFYAAEEELDHYGNLVIESENELVKNRREWTYLLETRIEQERTIGICEFAITDAKSRLAQADRMLRTSRERRRRFEIGAETLRARLKTGPTTLDEYFSILSEIEEAQSEAYDEWHSELTYQRGESERAIGSLLEKLNEAEVVVSDVTEDMEMINAQIDEVNDRYVEGRIQMALLKDRRERLKHRINEIGAEMQRLRQELNDAEAEALIKGGRVETGRAPNEILGEIRKISGILLGLVNVSEEAEAMYDSYSRTFEELRERVEQVRTSRRQVLEEIEERTRMWQNVTRELLDQVNIRYQNLLVRLQAGGEVRLVNQRDIEEAGLELYVGFKGAHQSRLDAYAHSGGERSTSVMAFLLALQQNVLAPFRAIDEFDLHMDPRNREVVSEFIVSTLEETDNQYIVITPSQVTFREKDVHIIMVHKTEGLSAIRVVE